MTELDVLTAAAAGMEAQRATLDVAARNVAAAETVPERSFARLVPQFAYASESESNFDVVPELDDPFAAEAPVRFTGTTTQRGASVDAITEMVALLDAERAYEANATVFDLGKRLAERTIDVGRA